MQPAAPALEVRRVLLPKRDAPLSECEDAIAVGRGPRRIAVADGATEGIDSRRWARRLTRSWTSAAADGADIDQLVACARRLGDRQQARWAGRAVPWYLEEKAALGSFAAFVGVTIDGDRWSAVAIGDCCLFVEDGRERRTKRGVERGARLVTSFPAVSSAEFGASPTLLPSHHGRYGDFAQFVRTADGTWGPGQRLLLLSDAISAWYFDEPQRGGEGAALLHAALDADDADTVARLVADERAARRLRNDDVAVLRVSWTEP